VLTTPEFHFSSCRVGQGEASDHRALVADLYFRSL